MPRSLAASLLLAFIASAPLASQSDTIPSPTADDATHPAAVSATGTPTFHSGQWGARFAVSDGFYGLGALLFTSPKTAWALTLSGYASYQSDEDISRDEETVGISIGRRWYGAGASRVRPIGGTGISANYYRSSTDYYGDEQTMHVYGGGLYGELGAAVFFTPELSLGATWRANLSASFWEGSDATSYTFSAGQVGLEGAFYF